MAGSYMKLSDEHLEQLTAYLDGELNAQERREVENLLRRDPQAAALLESLRQVSNSVAALPRELAPTGLSAAVQERLARRTLLDDKSDVRQELPRLVIWTNRLAVAACVGLVCTAGWLGMQSSGVRGPAVGQNDKNRKAPVRVDEAGKTGGTEKYASNELPGQPMPLGAAKPIGGQPDMPNPVAVEPVMVAHRDAGELEQRLNQTGLSNFDLQRADLSSISNQLVIETDDDEVRDDIVRLVADFAQKKGIPDVRSHKLPEPVQASQRFYVVNRPSPRKTAIAHDETWIGVNAPMRDTQELMDCVNKVRSMKKGPMQVEINGCAMETPTQAAQILADNSARNARRMSKQQDATEWGTTGAPPAAPMAVATASDGRSSKDGLFDDEASGAGREQSTGQEEESYKGSKSYGRQKSAEASKADPKKNAPVESETQRDADNETVKTESKDAGRVLPPPTRGAHAKEARAKEDKHPPPPASFSAPAVTDTPASQSADACVTLSICVRNPNPQRQRSEPTPDTQPSDTIRSSGATSMPQTSLPAAGADRE